MVNRHDVDELAGVTHPDFEFHSALEALEGRAYLGTDGMRQYLDEADSAWVEYGWELQEVHETRERAVVVMRFTGIGKASGAPVEFRSGQVWTWREGKLWRIDVYTDPAEAFRAAGLRQ